MLNVDIRIHFELENNESIEAAIERLEGNLRSIGLEYDELQVVIKE